MSAAQHLLDRVQSLATLEAFAADPSQYAALLAAEVSAAITLAELETRDAALANALLQIDSMIGRVMRLRLDHVLAADTSIATPTRRVFASTIVSYANDLPLLAQRVRDVAARGRAAAPEQIAVAIVDAARSTLALRDALRAGVVALIRELAMVSVADADRHARDRDLDEAQRTRWSAVRRELEAVAEDPSRVLAAPLATRLGTWPAQLDEAAPTPEVSFADMIEME